jgi:hypothetical protein
MYIQFCETADVDQQERALQGALVVVMAASGSEGGA